MSEHSVLVLLLGLTTVTRGLFSFTGSSYENLSRPWYNYRGLQFPSTALPALLFLASGNLTNYLEGDLITQASKSTFFSHTRWYGGILKAALCLFTRCSHQGLESQAWEIVSKNKHLSVLSLQRVCSLSSLCLSYGN